MSTEKLNIIDSVLKKSLNHGASSKTVHVITLELENNTSITLDFKQNYLRHLDKDSIENMINNFGLVELINSGEHQIINISENGAVPYKGNR